MHQPTNQEDAEKGNVNAIRHVAYSNGYSDHKKLCRELRSRTTDIELNGMIATLQSMSQRRKLPADGDGLYLGDGLPHAGLQLRSNLLLEALIELQALRQINQSTRNQS